MKINEVMSKCEWVAPTATLTEAAKMMKSLDTGFLPVGENDKLIGTITDRDMVMRTMGEGKSPEGVTVRDVMTQKLMYCYDDQGVQEICTNMAEIKVRRLPVVNREKRLVGVVSLGDLAQAQAPQSGEALKDITVENAQNCAKAA